MDVCTPQTTTTTATQGYYGQSPALSLLSNAQSELTEAIDELNPSPNAPEVTPLPSTPQSSAPSATTPSTTTPSTATPATTPTTAKSSTTSTPGNAELATEVAQLQQEVAELTRALHLQYGFSNDNLGAAEGTLYDNGSMLGNEFLEGAPELAETNEYYAERTAEPLP